MVGQWQDANGGRRHEFRIALWSGLWYSMCRGMKMWLVIAGLCTVTALFAVGREGRTGAEVEALIAEAGKAHPGWWEAVTLDYPPSLRLDWPEPRADKRWEPERNPGQYLSGIVYRHPGKWRATAKLFHHMLSVNDERPETKARIMDRLGHIYTALLSDYARGAFWYRSAASAGLTSTDQTVDLARCYWELGNGNMAAETLAQLKHPNSSAVLLWAQIGYVDRALQVAAIAAVGRQAAAVNVAAGEVCRSRGDYRLARAYYDKVNSGSSRHGRRRADVYRRCANAALAAFPVMASWDVGKIADGVYGGSAAGFRGDVEVSVAVRNHAIVGVEVLDHEEDWFFTSLEDIPRQLLAQQKFEGVDAVTGATVTSVAIMNAAAEALSGRTRR